MNSVSDLYELRTSRAVTESSIDSARSMTSLVSEGAS